MALRPRSLEFVRKNHNIDPHQEEDRGVSLQLEPGPASELCSTSRRSMPSNMIHMMLAPLRQL